ncbi:hypothetical protein BK702_04875 [Bacillus thuringiensis serovar cameroun]|nr:hypothetical protein BK702_04875 [Bacillus thuringiensis serovar cameroun]
MIHRYEIIFSVMYNDKITGLQSVIIPAYSLEDAIKKLHAEIKRRLGHCKVLICSTNVHVTEQVHYDITN